MADHARRVVWFQTQIAALNVHLGGGAVFDVEHEPDARHSLRFIMREAVDIDDARAFFAAYSALADGHAPDPGPAPNAEPYRVSAEELERWWRAHRRRAAADPRRTIALLLTLLDGDPPFSAEWVDVWRVVADVPPAEPPREAPAAQEDSPPLLPSDAPWSLCQARIERAVLAAYPGDGTYLVRRLEQELAKRPR